MSNVLETLGNPTDRSTPEFWKRLLRSKSAALVWTAMRVWLGIMWIQAGVAKIWGAENPAFLHHNGAGVAGFAAHGSPAYSWWGSFLHHVVIPNSSSIGVLIAYGELAVGIGLAFGLLTRTAAICSLIMLFTYVMSGTASVCAFYALFAIVILVTWRTSSWIGADGVIAKFRAANHPHHVEAPAASEPVPVNA